MDAEGVENRPDVVETAPSRAAALPSEPGWRRRWLLRLIALAVVVALFAIFVLQNDDQVPVKLIGWDFEIGLAWALLISGGGGLVLGLLVSWLKR
jgi:uncharacterized integral membrane protein